MSEAQRPGPHRRPGGPMLPSEKAKDVKGAFKKLVAYMGSYRIGLIFVMIFAVAGTVFNVVGPKILSKATTEIFSGLMKKIQGSGGIDFSLILRIILILVLLYVVSAVFSFVQGMIMTGISQKLCFRMRKEISEKINRMPMKYFESRTHGEVLSRITNDVDTLGMSLNQTITQTISAVATLIGVIVMMLSISPLMTLISILILPVSGIVIGVIVKNSQKYFTMQQEYLGHVNGQVEEVFGGHHIVKAFNKEEDVLEEFKKNNDILYRSAWKSQFLSGMMMPIMNFVGNLGYVGVAVAGSILAIRGTIQVGDIQAFIQYINNLTQPIRQVSQIFNMLQSMAAAAERVFEFLEEEEEDQVAEEHAKKENGENFLPGELTGEVTFEHVKFGYQPIGKIADALLRC